MERVAQNGFQISVLPSGDVRLFFVKSDKLQTSTGQVLVQGNTFNQPCCLNADCGCLKFSSEITNASHIWKDTLVMQNLCQNRCTEEWVAYPTYVLTVLVGPTQATTEIFGGDAAMEALIINRGIESVIFLQDLDGILSIQVELLCIAILLSIIWERGSQCTLTGLTAVGMRQLTCIYQMLDTFIYDSFIFFVFLAYKYFIKDLIIGSLYGISLTGINLQTGFIDIKNS